MPTPSPAALTAAELAPWTALAGTLFAALVALAGVIILFALQQRAQRKEQRRLAQDAAYARLAQTFRDAIERMRAPDYVLHHPVHGMTHWDETHLGLISTSWHIDSHDEFVVVWLSTRLQVYLQELLDVRSVSDQVGVAQNALQDITLVLREWRDGEVRPAGLKADTERLRAVKDALVEARRSREQ